MRQLIQGASGVSRSDFVLAVAALAILGVLASQVFAAGTKCPTGLNLGTQQIQCSGLDCTLDGAAGKCRGFTFSGFVREVTVYTVTWDENVATVTPHLTYPSPGPLNSTFESCACKVVDEEEQTTTWGDDYCCDAGYAEVPGEPRRPATIGTCQDDGCADPNPNCTLVVTGTGFMAEAECTPNEG